MPTTDGGWKTSLRKVRTLWHCSRLRSVALYLWLIVVISVRQSWCSNICDALPGNGYGQFRYKADSLIAKFKEAGGTVRRDWSYEQSHRDYLRSDYHRVSGLSWAVNHYRDNAITYKAQRDKNARELKLANAAITDHADASAWCCCARCKMKELADAKAENDALRDDVAAGRRRLLSWSLPASQCVGSPPPPAWII